MCNGPVTGSNTFADTEVAHSRDNRTINWKNDDPDLGGFGGWGEIGAGLPRRWVGSSLQSASTLTLGVGFGGGGLPRTF
jgi:hypothetical protein